MSILGYSSAYFFPEYWSSTPLYGEKIIPLIDYVLSTDYAQADKLASAFYMMENKYKNTGDLPIDCIKEIIYESGYQYVLDLLGNDENSIRLLVYLLVLVHQLKGTKRGIETVLNLLKRNTNPMVLNTVGSIQMHSGIVSGFTTQNYIYFEGFSTDTDPFEIIFPIKTGSFEYDQTIASVGPYRFYLGLNTFGKLVFSLGTDKESWNLLDPLTGTSIGQLFPNTEYNIKVAFDGYEYTVDVKEKGDAKYSNYIFFGSRETLNIHMDKLYLGIDYSTGESTRPFRGSIDLAPFTSTLQNMKVTQWFEAVPMGEENTFQVKADLDLGVVSSDFFEKFAAFVEKYVYPTLEAFEADLNLENNLTFIPYNRQRFTYLTTDEGNEKGKETVILVVKGDLGQIVDSDKVIVNGEEYFIKDLDKRGAIYFKIFDVEKDSTVTWSMDTLRNNYYPMSGEINLEDTVDSNIVISCTTDEETP